MKKILLFCLCLVSFPLICNAKNCTDEEAVAERQYLDNVDVSYTVSIKNNVANYTITLKNLTNNMLFKTENSKLIKSDLFKNGRYSFALKKAEPVRITIYSKACGADVISTTKDIIVPAYNKYYSREECKDFQSNYVCQKWSAYSADEKTFQNDIKKLKELQEKKNNNTPDDKVYKNKKWYEIMREVVSKYWWAFTLLVLLTIGIYYMIWSKQKKEQFDFKV